MSREFSSVGSSRAGHTNFRGFIKNSCRPFLEVRVENNGKFCRALADVQTCEKMYSPVYFYSRCLRRAILAGRFRGNLRFSFLPEETKLFKRKKRIPREVCLTLTRFPPRRRADFERIEIKRFLHRRGAYDR